MWRDDGEVRPARRGRARSQPEPELVHHARAVRGPRSQRARASSPCLARESALEPSPEPTAALLLFIGPQGAVLKTKEGQIGALLLQIIDGICWRLAAEPGDAR